MWKAVLWLDDSNFKLFDLHAESFVSGAPHPEYTYLVVAKSKREKKKKSFHLMAWD